VFPAASSLFKACVWLCLVRCVVKTDWASGPCCGTGVYEHRAQFDSSTCACVCLLPAGSLRVVWVGQRQHQQQAELQQHQQPMRSQAGQQLTTMMTCTAKPRPPRLQLNPSACGS
jgi:hypothetical protein